MRPLSGLVVKVGSRLCAIPLEHVVETMRPLPVERVAQSRAFVLGLAIVRGAPLLVLDASALVGVSRDAPPNRFVTIRERDRSIVLAVDGVIGVADLDAKFESLPPLVQASDVVDAIAPLDEKLLMVLRAARIVETALS
jgi:purine-binding chemotaxis protein CheW